MVSQIPDSICWKLMRAAMITSGFTATFDRTWYENIADHNRHPKKRGKQPRKTSV
jgi:hypothetical protein